MLKIKLTLALFSLLFINANAFSQISRLISDFKPSYISGDVSKYINNGEDLVSSLKPEEKTKGQRILTLFKVLTGKEQDMSTADFNRAMSDVGLSALLEKSMNSNLSLISLRLGNYRSYLVFNQSKKNYKFSLKGLYKTVNKIMTNNFDGGVYDYHCRIVSYTEVPYTYTVSSITELPSLF